MQERGWKHGVVRVRVCGQKKSHNSDEAWFRVEVSVSRSRLIGHERMDQSQRPANLPLTFVPAMFKSVNAASFPISGGILPLLLGACTGSGGGEVVRKHVFGL